MPLYEYECLDCEFRFEERRSVDLRDVAACPQCVWGDGKRVFTPTASIVIAEHFRHNQADFLPPAWDTAAWESRGRDSTSHVAAKRDDSKEFEEFVRRDMAEQGASL